MLKKVSASIALLFFSAFAFSEVPTFQDVLKKSFPDKASFTIYPAKEVVTMDGQGTTAKAVAVNGNRIVAVGTVEELQAFLHPAKTVVNHRFSNKIIVPGLIDQHIHPLLSALTMTAEIIAIEDWELPGETVKGILSREGYMKRLIEADRRIKDPDKLLLTWGFHHYFHGKLTRKDLDAVNARRPIIVWHRSAHEFILNSAALSKYGIDKSFLNKQSPSTRAQISLPEGHFWEQGMLALLPKIAQAVATPDRLRKGLEFTEHYLHANGVTTSAEPGGIVSKELQDMQNSILGDAQTPFRFYYIADGKTMALQHLDDGKLIEETEKMLDWGEGHTAFLPKQTKLFADGAIFSQLMQMKDGYSDGHSGEWMIEPDVFAKAFKEYWDAGYQIHIHQNGDAGLQMVIDALKKNMLRNPRYDHRTTIVHFGFSDPEQIRTLRSLGAIVSANPYYTVALADKYGKDGLDPERADNMVRLGEAVRENIPVSLHSDMPMAPARPLFLMWCAVNRQTVSGRVAGPDQKISAEKALAAVTIDAAFSLRLEKEIGSIEPGKLANFTILEENPLTVNPLHIKDIKVWGTVLEGRVQPIE